jgi:peptidoglycan/LPS O-acetylase OafA/YrhL
MGVENTTARPDQIAFLVWVRGLACLLVVWDHLVAIWADRHGLSFPPLTLIRQYFTTPLGIIQDFGYLGVVLFFFVSGFIITHVAQRESGVTFLIKRLFRIYPPFIVSIMIIMLFQTFYFYYLPSNPGMARYLHYDDVMSYRSWSDILAAMTLINYVRIPQNVVNGVAWTLVIEVVFYLACFFVLPLLRRRPLSAALILLVACLWIVHVARNHGAEFFLFAASVAYIPLLLIGQLTYLVWSGRITAFWFSIGLLGNWAVFLYATLSIHSEFYPPENSYAISTLYAYGVFVLLLVLNERLRVPKLVQFYSNLSYSLYLYHGLIGYLVLAALYPLAGFTIALAATVLAVTGVSYCSWRYVELPSQHAARHLLRQFASRRQTRQPIGRA